MSLYDSQPGYETKLQARVAAGDESAFNQLFWSYKDRIFGYVMAITHSHERAEEITQQLFIKLWQSRHLLAEVDNIDNYLFAVARLRTISFLRNMFRDEKGLRKLQTYMVNPPAENSDARLIEAEYTRAITEAIGRLPAQRREVFLRSREQGLTYEQIASQMNLSKHTVRNHLAEALKQLRSDISKQGVGFLLLFSIVCDLTI